MEEIVYGFYSLAPILGPHSPVSQFTIVFQVLQPFLIPRLLCESLDSFAPASPPPTPTHMQYGLEE